MIEQGGFDYDNPYKFNGKELDPETGYYYYGARYYDPVVSRWLSVDPLAERFAGLSPYNYVFNNPLIFIDPTGKGGEKATDEWIRFSTGEVVRVGDKGGDKLDYITVVNEDGSTYEVIKPAGSMKESAFFEKLHKVKPVIESSQKLKPVNIPFDYKDISSALISGAEGYTKKMNHGGGYLTTSWAKSGRRFYWKPNARGLNNLKGISFNVNKSLKYGGPAVAFAFEIPEIVDGYKVDTHEGNKQLAGAVGTIGGGWIGGVLAGAALGAVVGIETGPGAFVTSVFGALIGAYIGEEGVERLYDKITGHD